MKINFKYQDSKLEKCLRSILPPEEILKQKVTVGLWTQSGECVLSNSKGINSVVKDVSINNSQLIPVNCLIKPLIAHLFFILEKNFYFSFDHDINLSQFGVPSEYHRITLIHILMHTSGLRDYELAEGSCGPINIFSKPGELFSYSNLGYSILVRFLEQQTSLPLRSLLNRYIFNPLGIHLAKHRFIRTNQEYFIPCLSVAEMMKVFKSLSLFADNQYLHQINANEVLNKKIFLPNPSPTYQFWTSLWANAGGQVFAHNGAYDQRRLVLNFKLFSNEGMIIDAPYSVAPMLSYVVAKRVFEDSWKEANNLRIDNYIYTDEISGVYNWHPKGQIRVHRTSGGFKGDFKLNNVVVKLRIAHVDKGIFLIEEYSKNLRKLFPKGVYSFIQDSCDIIHCWNGLQLNSRIN